MSITKDPGRQLVVSARVDVSFDDFEDAKAHPAIAMPAAAVVTGGQFVVDEAFDTGATVDVGVDSSNTEYVSGAAADATGSTEVTTTGYAHGGNDPIVLSLSNGGAATKGSGFLIVNYVVKDRAEFSQGV